MRIELIKETCDLLTELIDSLEKNNPLKKVLLELKTKDLDEDFSNFIDHNIDLFNSLINSDLSSEQKDSLKYILNKNENYKYAKQENSNNNEFSDVNHSSDPFYYIKDIVRKYLPNYCQVLSKDSEIIYTIQMKRTGIETEEELIEKTFELVLASFLGELINEYPGFQILPFSAQEEVIIPYFPKLRRDAAKIINNAKENKVSDKFIKFFNTKSKKEILRFFKNEKMSSLDLNAIIENSREFGFQHKRINVEMNSENFWKSFYKKDKFRKKAMINEFFEKRKDLVCHFFYNDETWHCFYWSGQDIEGKHGKHWDRHIHYNSSLTSDLSMSDFEEKLKSFNYSNDIHVHYILD